jgi:hypothetical protein
MYPRKLGIGRAEEERGPGGCVGATEVTLKPTRNRGVPTIAREWWDTSTLFGPGRAGHPWLASDVIRGEARTDVRSTSTKDFDEEDPGIERGCSESQHGPGKDPVQPTA